MQRVAIVRALRTPIGKFMGGLSGLTAPDLGVAVVEALLDGFDLTVDELALGCARQAGQRTNPARQIAVRAGLGFETFSTTVNSACASGLTAMVYGVQQIQLGRAGVVVAGGVEAMSRVPFMLDRMRSGYRLGHARLVDGMYQDGFHCPLADQLMGRTAETLAERYDISREEQDEFALGSQQKAGRATAGVDPSVMGIAPVPATRKLLDRTGATLGDFGLIELNEAFAAQVLACDRELKLDRDRLNVNGGAIALGHPIGCTAARIVVTLLHAMRRRGVERGLATLCVSGGLGMAASFRTA